MTERCSLWSALSAAACCFYRGSFVQVQVCLDMPGAQVSPSPAGRAVQDGAAAVRGLNGRGWRGGPGPRLSAEHPLGMALLGVGTPR